jgi:hypothetical protein
MNGNQSLVDRLAEIETLTQTFLTDCQRALGLCDIATQDFMVLAAIKRTLGLSAGFKAMIENRNFTCAAPLIRLQLDCGLRLSALNSVDDPKRYADAFFKGEKLDKFKSKTKARMTDRYLVSVMIPTMPWVESVYEDTCEFVHLSSKSLWNSIAKSDNGTKIVHFQLSATDPVRDGDEKYYSAVEAYRKVLVLTTVVTLHFLSKPGAAQC